MANCKEGYQLHHHHGKHRLDFTKRFTYWYLAADGLEHPHFPLGVGSFSRTVTFTFILLLSPQDHAACTFEKSIIPKENHFSRSLCSKSRALRQEQHCKNKILPVDAIAAFDPYSSEVYMECKNNIPQNPLNSMDQKLAKASTGKILFFHFILFTLWPLAAM